MVAFSLCAVMDCISWRVIWVLIERLNGSHTFVVGATIHPAAVTAYKSRIIKATYFPICFGITLHLLDYGGFLGGDA